MHQTNAADPRNSIWITKRPQSAFTRRLPSFKI